MFDFSTIELKATQGLIRFRWPLFFLSFLLTALAGLGLQQFALDADPRAYFADDNEHLQHHQKLENQYGQVDNVRFALQFEDGVFNKKNLGLLQEFTEASWQLPYAQRADSITNYAYSWSQEDDLFVEELVSDAEALTEEDIEKIKSIALSDPDILYRLSTDQAEIAVVDVRVFLPNDDRITEEGEVAKAAHELAEAYETKYPLLEIALSGNTISDTAMIQTGLSDSAKLIPIMYLIIFTLLFFFLRSFSAVFIIFLITASSTAAAIGIASHLGYVLTMLSITAMNIVITVSIAHCVHLLNGFLENYRSGVGKEQSLIDSIRINLQPIFLTTFTTMLGFLSMNLSKMPPAHDLGNISAMGVFIAFALSLTLLPALVLAMPVKQNLKVDREGFQHRMEQLAEFVIGKRHLLLIGSTLFSLIMLGLVTQNEINDTFTENIKKPSQFRSDNDLFDEYFGGLYTLEFDFKAASGKNISDPEYLNALEKFSEYARAHPRVTNVRSYTDIIKRLNKNMHGDDEAFYALPKSQEEAAQYLLLFEFSQPQGSDMTNFIHVDKLGTRLIISTKTMDSTSLRNMGIELRKWVRLNLPEYMHAEPTSLIYMWTFLGPTAMVSSLSGALFALFIISVILTIVFKSFRYGIISLIPNLLPAGVGYGIWAVYSGMLQMSQVMVLSITIGIVVDDTVHFLSKYLRARREHDADAQDAVRYAFKHVGAPLWITTVALVAGFGLLISSSFVPNSDLGSLTAMILVSALVLDFFMLPPLLMLLDKKKKELT
jgi:predicted RND superfamily exporter protein